MPAKITLSPTQRYSYADYLTWLDDARREIIGGIVSLMTGTTSAHSGISASIISHFYAIVDRHSGECCVYVPPLDVRLPVNGETRDEEIFTVVQPDVCVVCDPSKIDERGCLGAPDLIVEILSPSTSKRDRNTKFDLYERSGVREYWIVSPEGRWVRVFVLQPDGCYDKGGVLYEETSSRPIMSVVLGETVSVATFFKRVK